MMWKDKYRINVGLIDQQHEELLNGFQIFFRWFKQRTLGGQGGKVKRPWYSCRIMWNPISLMRRHTRNRSNIQI